MKYLITLLTLCLSMYSCKLDENSRLTKEGTKAQQSKNTSSALNWLSIDELENLDMSGKKGVLVDVYTDWCGYCKIMDKHTFTDPEVVAYLSANYHLIKFNAEQKEPIQYRGQTYEWKSGGRKGYNTLAKDFLEGQMSYPSMVYFDENKEKIIAVPGYKKPQQLLKDIERIQKLPM